MRYPKRLIRNMSFESEKAKVWVFEQIFHFLAGRIGNRNRHVDLAGRNQLLMVLWWSLVAFGIGATTF
jgi:hypothetical protein